LPVTTLFYTVIAGTLFCGGFLPFAAIAPGLADAGLMLLLGLLGVVSQFGLIRAFAAAPANIVAPFGYIALVCAALVGLLIFGEIPCPRTLFGVGLIAGAGLFVFLRGSNMSPWRICRILNVMCESSPGEELSRIKWLVGPRP
jgi:drug/metabolite transporter (DMT)-like permease